MVGGTFTNFPKVKISSLKISAPWQVCFLFVLNCAFQMFLGSCFTILYMFRKSLKNVRRYFNHIGFWYLFFKSIHLLILCGDVEQNPRPKDMKYLSLCHWNLNSLAAHDFAKVSAKLRILLPRKNLILYVCHSHT